jgi:hypothetical protein
VAGLQPGAGADQVGLWGTRVADAKDEGEGVRKLRLVVKTERVIDADQLDEYIAASVKVHAKLLGQEAAEKLWNSVKETRSVKLEGLDVTTTYELLDEN